MDLVHRADDRKWICPRRIPLGQHFEHFSDLVHERTKRRQKGQKRSMPAADNKSTAAADGGGGGGGSCDDQGHDYRGGGGSRETNVIRAIMNTDDMDEVIFQEIEENCCLDNLDLPDELPPMALSVDREKSVVAAEINKVPRFRPVPIPQSGLFLLETLQLQQQFQEHADKEGRLRRMRVSRYGNSGWFESMPPRPNRVNAALADKEIVITARVYRPFHGNSSRNTLNVVNCMRYSQEILLLGSNKLSDLRDKIRCNNDHMVAGDVSQDPYKKGARKNAKEEYRSGFFYIEGCFYNDMRWPECIDYSQVIRDWATNPSRMIGPFTTAKMEDTLVKDLEVRIGYPYVYVHQGEHEHLICITDARLLGADDIQRPSEYPVERSIGMRHSKYCMVCAVNIAKWVTKDNERVPEDPFFFCDHCFRSFNYSKNIPLGKFKAYQFVDVNAI